jgi:alkaline phosphatase/streptomycin-6-phosphatase
VETGRTDRYLPVIVAAALAAVWVLTFSALQLPGVAPLAQDGDRTGQLRQAIVDGSARNILLFVGDGLGDSEITLARNYAVGAAGRLALDQLRFTGAYTTYSVREDEPAKPDYVPDSAATGTAWATGTKTSNGRISTTAGTDRDLKTILELAQDRGFRTGNVTTAELTDATPAVLASHVANRACQGPADMAACPQDRKTAGGAGSIAEQLVDHRVDVLLGGGRSRFEQRTAAGRSVLDQAAAAGYRVIGNATELESTAREEKVLGLFAPGNMSLEWSGLEAVPYPSNINSPQRCQVGRRTPDEPSLSAMTAKAIELLEQPGTRGPGFFLQVEGASIDKQSHTANPCGQIGETIAFDAAVRVGLEYARAHRNTLLVVTGDHGHSAQIVGTPSDTDHPTGLLSVLTTADGVPLTVSYGTNLYHRSQDHTGTQIRIAAEGPQAANVVGVTDQTELFRLMLRALGPASQTKPSRQP